MNQASDEMQRWIEIYKGMIALSIEAFKISALANGGAAVALLAFLGETKNPRWAENLQIPMGLFLFGLFFCALSILYSYFNHRNLARELDPAPTVARQPDPRERPRQLRLAVVTYVLSLLFFIVGAGVAVNNFSIE
jgi:hypothetical protein